MRGIGARRRLGRLGSFLNHPAEFGHLAILLGYTFFLLHHPALLFSHCPLLVRDWSGHRRRRDGEIDPTLLRPGPRRE
ncbi:MAG: hypothetical protein BZY88_16470 [SAR202 cluster bacterium Io17-Chloro-G9]|nr:MAG: hypothetical protein BZY88_16470 [SAR202 cluster bacterium Io17-Chloro-G9]